jgi:hypothetical protein
MQKNDTPRAETEIEPERELEVGEDGLVPIYHSSGLVDARVLPKAVRGWERQGWSTTKPAKPADGSSDGPAPDGPVDAGTPTVTEPDAPAAPTAGRAKSDAAPAAKNK